MRFDSGLLAHGGDLTDFPQVNEWSATARLLESAGYTGVWSAEHHFCWDGWTTPTPTNPLLAGAFMAAHTETLRLGTCGVCLPDWHPIRAAEDAATVDHMSGGRLDFGFMRGINNRVNGNFNAAADRRDQKTNGELLWESFEIVKKAWAGGPFRHEGDHYTFPFPGWHDKATLAEDRDSAHYAEDGEMIALEVVPTPYQKPMPPCWLMADSASSTALAASKGVGAINWGQSFEGTREVWAAYKAAAAEANVDPSLANHRVAMMRPVFVAETSEKAEAVMRPAINSLFEHIMGLTPSWNGRKAFLASHEEPTEADTQAEWYDFLKKYDWCLVGTPAEVTEQLKRFETELGCEHFVAYWALPLISFEQMSASTRLFADEVMPNFASSPAVAAT
jgi:alkanesulfonate monooxygenase SsuD/methylene tetrahydromethanopterin reductase-like flavin-dependent oxidoreductase (luciferase family)